MTEDLNQLLTALDALYERIIAIPADDPAAKANASSQLLDVLRQASPGRLTHGVHITNSALTDRANRIWQCVDARLGTFPAQREIVARLHMGLAQETLTAKHIARMLTTEPA